MYGTSNIVLFDEKNIYFLTTLQLYLCSLYGRILMDVTVLTLEGPCRKLLDSLLSMKRRLSLSLENCVLNSILCARFEMYIAFFSIFNNFCKDFYSSIHIVVSAHAFEIISEARENQREYWPGFKFLSIILQRVY